MRRIILIPVAHVSKKSIARVRKKIIKEKPRFVALELCRARFGALKERRTAGRRAGGFVSALYIFQKLAERLFGSRAGSEMLEAAEAARKVGAEVVFIDRDIGETAAGLRRVPIGEKIRFVLGLPLAFAELWIKGKKVIDDISKQATVEWMLAGMREKFPNFYKVLVEERDEYMAHRIAGYRGKIVAVVGAGHVRGIRRNLKRILGKAG